MAIHPEQTYVVGVFDGKFYLSDGIYDQMPWHLLSKTWLYCIQEEDLHALLVDAASRGYMVLDGAKSDRKGIRGFQVAVGPWGVAGKVNVLSLDAWGFAPLEGLREGELVAAHQMGMRSLVERLNGEETGFRASALKWLSGLYHRLGRINEPNGVIPPPLPKDVAAMARAAHVGGPVMHVRSSLKPFVSLDRKRAYGEALLGDLPCGSPVEVDLGIRPLVRWTPKALMRGMGLAEATVKVHMGPLVSLLPVMDRHDENVERTRTLYPTGVMQGTFTLAELAYLEESGRGEVEGLNRVVVFERGQPFRPVVRYLRSIERDIPQVKVKNLEHMMYGRCARSLRVTRFSSARADVRPMPSDILDAKTMERLTTRVKLHRFGLPPGPQAALPMYEVVGQLSEAASPGTIDRPDRSAWITAQNRIEMSKIIDRLDEALGAERSGSFVGRIYVDGIDIEARLEDLPNLPGVSVKAHGSEMQIYRSGSTWSILDDGTEAFSSTSVDVRPGWTRQDFEADLQTQVDPDGGPLTGGRHWKSVPGVQDPRMVPDQVSQPLHLDLPFLKAVGLC